MRDVRGIRALAAVASGALLAAAAVQPAQALSSGDTDTAYGTDGLTTVSYGQNGVRVTDVEQLADGRTVLAGEVITSTITSGGVTSFTYDVVLMRFTASGFLDSTFNASGSTPGILQLDLGDADRVSDIALDESVEGAPRILLAGASRSAGPDRMVVARVAGDGTPDTTFGADGQVVLPFVTNEGEELQAGAEAYAVAARPDGRVVVGGSAKDSTVYASGRGYAIAGLTESGEPDPAFATVRGFVGGGGVGEQTSIQELAVDADGSVVAVMLASVGFAEFRIVRVPEAGGQIEDQETLLADGVGALRLLPPADGETRGAALVGGEQDVSFQRPMYWWSVERRLPDLTLDTGFGTSGRWSQDIGGGMDRLDHLDVAVDGSLIASGVVGRFGPENVGVARLSPSGQLITSFGTSGIARVSVGTYDNWGAAVVQGGRLVVVSNIHDGTNYGGVGITRILTVVATASIATSTLVTETDEGETSTATVGITLSEPSPDEITVGYETWVDPADWLPATVGSDYTATSGTVTFAPGETSKSFTVTVNGDADFEDIERIPVRLTTITGPVKKSATASAGAVGIEDNDPQPLLSVSDAQVTEKDSGTTTATLTITQSHVCPLPTYITWVTDATVGAANQATADADYAFAYVTTEIPAGETSLSIDVSVLADNVVEGTEVFDVRLVPSGGVGLCSAGMADDRGTVTILDDDQADTTKPTIAWTSVPAGAVLSRPTFRWSAADAGGIANYRVAVRTVSASGALSAATTITTTSTSYTLPDVVGRTTCLAVSAVDTAGNVSAPTASRCTTIAADDRSLTLRGTWRTVSGTSWYRGRAVLTSTKGATATLPSTSGTRKLALVVQTGKGYGSFGVFVGSTRVAVVSLASTTTRNRVIKTVSIPSTALAPITLRVLTSGARVAIDGYAIVR